MGEVGSSIKVYMLGSCPIEVSLVHVPNFKCLSLDVMIIQLTFHDA